MKECIKKEQRERLIMSETTLLYIALTVSTATLILVATLDGVSIYLRKKDRRESTRGAGEK